MRVWIAIWTGSSAITKAICDWIRGGVALRLLGVGLAAGFIKGLPWTTYLLGGLAQAWLLTAVYLGLRLPDPTKPATDKSKEPAGDTTERPDGEGAQTEGADEPTGEGEQAAAQQREQPSRALVVEALHGLLQDTGGVHLQALAKALPHGPWQTRDVRSLLASHSIRVRDGVRVPGVGPREGVHRDDVPPLPSPDADPTPGADVAAGQSNNNNGNNTRAEFVQDDTNPNRWHVLPRRLRATAGTGGQDAT